MKKIWFWAAAVSLMVNGLLLYKYDGLSSVAVVAVIVIGLGWFKYRKDGALDLGFKLTAVYLVLMSGVLALTTIPEIRFLTGVVLVVGMGVLMMSFKPFRWTFWIVEWFRKFFVSITRGMGFFTMGQKVSGKHGKLAGQILIGLVISVPIVFVALALLGNADQVFGDMLDKVAELFDRTFLARTTWRVIVFLFVAIYFFGKASVPGTDMPSPAPDMPSPAPDMPSPAPDMPSPAPLSRRQLPPAVSGTVLVVLDVIYVVFAVVQFAFLFRWGAVFGTETTVPGTAYHYANYARQGFFELVALSILNTAGIILVHMFTEDHRAIRIGLTVTVACNMVMIASSAYKMNLYENAYGYTRDRLYVYLILAFLAVFMVLQESGLWKDSWKPVEWAIAGGLIYFLIIGYMDTDSFIARENIARYEKTGEVDAYYLLGLSEDAWPEVLVFAQDHPEEVRGMGSQDRLEQIEEKLDDTRYFFEYNIRHEKAMKALESYSAFK